MINLLNLNKLHLDNIIKNKGLLPKGVLYTTVFHDEPYFNENKRDICFKYLCDISGNTKIVQLNINDLIEFIDNIIFEMGYSISSERHPKCKCTLKNLNDSDDIYDVVYGDSLLEAYIHIYDSTLLMHIPTKSDYIANDDTIKFIELMLDEDYVFNFINNDIFDGKPDFINRKSNQIHTALRDYGCNINFDLSNVESGWVFNQLELGGLERTDFKKDFSNAL